MVLHWVYYVLLLVLLFTGLFAVIFSLPGLWVMIGSVIAYAAVTGWLYVGWKTIVVLVMIGVAAEVVETVAGGAGAKRAGASKRGIIGAIVGGFLGAIFLSIPLPIIGTIIGACLGSLLGAVIVELSIGRELEQSMRIGMGAAKGRFVGIMSKLGFGTVILGIALWSGFPLGPATMPTTTAPVTAPSVPRAACPPVPSGKTRRALAASCQWHSTPSPWG